MTRPPALLAALALVQLAMPAQAAHPTMIAVCGSGAAVPLPMKNRGGDSPCCKICHSAMRKRSGGGKCCEETDEEEEAGQ